jgi:hypothetical protein
MAGLSLKHSNLGQSPEKGFCGTLLMNNMWRGRGNHESSPQYLPLHNSNLGSSSAHHAHLGSPQRQHPSNHHELERLGFPVPPPQSNMATSTWLYPLANLERNK